jgi:hypothetical protein
MKNFKRVLLLILISTHYVGFSKLKIPQSKMCKSLKLTKSVIQDEDYTIWGSSPIVGEDGKIHVFCARWPELNVAPGWRYSSEVAHYVADSPESEFKYVETVIKGTGRNTWDKYAPHNPEIKKFGKYYVIVFIAHDGSSNWKNAADQKIGMVYSESINGPWKKAGNQGLIIAPSTNENNWTYKSKNGVCNPSINFVNGKYIVYFKAVENAKHSHTKFGYAYSDHVLGPYKIYPKPITNNKTHLEDATSFSYNNIDYLLTTDNAGGVTGERGGLTLWTSKGGVDFSMDHAQIAALRYPKYYKSYNESKTSKIYGAGPKFERPKVLLIDGKPTYLFAPSGWNQYGGKRTVCNILKIEEF